MAELISVIVPVYNAERYLGECIDSIIAQSYENWELILIDDGSTDNSKDILADYARRDDRIRVYHNDNNGVSYTRNFGIEVSRGEYLCFIDADDKILSDYLSTLFDKISKNAIDIAFCGCRLLYGNRSVEKTSRIKEGVYRFEELSDRAIDDGTLSGILFGAVWGALYRSSLIKENNIRFLSSVRINEDGLFNLELLPYTKGIAVSEYAGYIYRQWCSVNRERTKNRITDELSIVSDIIAQKCPSFNEINKQLKCREMSIVFWDVQKIAARKQSVFLIAKELKCYVLQTNLHRYYSFLNFSELNRYKKLLINMIYKKHYFLFGILVKYLKPIIEKRFKH